MIKKRGEERGKGRQDKNVKSYKSYRWWRKLFFLKRKNKTRQKEKENFSFLLQCLVGFYWHNKCEISALLHICKSPGAETTTMERQVTFHIIFKQLWTWWQKTKQNLVINLLLHEYKTSHLHFLCLRKSVIFIILSLNLNTWVHISITGQSLAHWLIRWAALIRGFVETYRWSWWPRLHSDWSSWRHLWTCLDLGLAEDRNTNKSSSSVYWCHFPHVPHSGRTAIQWRWASPFFTAATRVNEKQTARSTQTRKALTFYCNCRAATLFTPPVSLCSCTSTYSIADQSKFPELMGGRINKSNVWISTAAEHCMYHIHCKWSSNNVKQM